MPTKLASATARLIDRITHSAIVVGRLTTLVLLAALGLSVVAPAPARAQSFEWTLRAVSGPSPRYFHAMAFDAPRGVTVLFGGSSNSNSYNGETWEWNGIAWTERMVSGPSPRFVHAMAYDAARGVTVLFGGSNGSVSNAETWEWDGTAWTQRVVSGPSLRIWHAMAYDSVRGVTVLFGGTRSGQGPRNGETWEWNGTAWTQRAVSGPSPRFAPAVAYDASRRATVLFGGATADGANGETWEWNGTAWTQLVVGGPSARVWHAMVYDSARDVTVFFGGLFTGGDETWEWGPCATPSITAQPAAQTGWPGGSASFTVTATSYGHISYQWRKDSVNLADKPDHISGVNAATLGIVNTTEADEGSYDCVIANGCGSVTSDDATFAICTADFNCDHSVNSQDFFDFLAAFFVSTPAADFNHDGAVNSQDFFDFLTAFFIGC